MIYKYRDGKWINEPEAKLDFSKKFYVNFYSVSQEDKINIENQNIIEEVEKHNKNREKEIQCEQQKELESLAYGYLKTNEMI